MSIQWILAEASGVAAPASAPVVEPVSYVMASALTFVALGVAWALGVFKPHAVVGPTRLGAKDSAGAMLAVLGLTVLTWVMAPLMVAQLLHIQIYETLPTTQAAEPGASDVVKGTTGVEHGTSDAAPATDLPAMRPEALVTLGAIGAAAAFILCVLMTVLYRPGGLTRLGLGAGDLLHAPLIGLASALVAIPLVLASGIYTAGLWDVLGLNHPTEHQLLQILNDPSKPGLRNLIVFTAVVLAPMSEELIFRGHVQTLLVRLVGGHKPSRAVLARWIAIVLASLLFSLAHEWWMRPPIFLLSLCLGYLYERTGNLWACVFLHALFNASNTALSMLQPS